MTDDDLQTVHRWFEALNEEDFDAATAMLHPDVELVPPGGQPPYRGASSLRRWMEPDALHKQVIRPLQSEIGLDGRILVRQHVSARGASSGIELDTHSWTVWTFEEDGMVRRIQIFLDHEEIQAREAAGLPPHRD